jgi:hypothetical protein
MLMVLCVCVCVCVATGYELRVSLYHFNLASSPFCLVPNFQIGFHTFSWDWSWNAVLLPPIPLQFGLQACTTPSLSQWF